jgi:CRP-like cAMP-binding protein
MLASLGMRIARFEEVLLDLVTARTMIRLARLLSRLIPRGAKSEWIRLPVSPTNPELARMIGTTRWRVSHFLTEFQKAGWLRRDNGFWVNPEGLRQFLQSRHNE